MEERQSSEAWSQVHDKKGCVRERWTCAQKASRGKLWKECREWGDAAVGVSRACQNRLLVGWLLVRLADAVVQLERARPSVRWRC